MNLGHGCPVGTIMHEFLHSLGVYHEQSRDDRDDYIYVDFSQIEPGGSNLSCQAKEQLLYK